MVYYFLADVRRVVRAFSCLFIFFCFSVQAATAPDSRPESVAFWYADTPPLPELSQFDWVVLEPGHASVADVAFLSAQGALPFAYLSVGEVDGGMLAEAQSAGVLSGTANTLWQSQVADLSNPKWQAMLLERAKSYHEQGYDGLFLDTLDSFTLLADERQPAQREGLLALLEALHEQLPGMKLFFNRGFEVLPAFAGVVDAVAVESLSAGWNAASQTYVPVSASDREWLNGQLAPLKDVGIPLVAIEYLPADQPEQARSLAKELVSEGYIPVITSPDLDRLGISSIEVQSRRIALVYDPREGELTLNPGHVYLGGLLEYLGYRVDYIPADADIPLSPMSGLYAGVVIWMTSGTPADVYRFNEFISARLDEHIPVAFMGGIPIDNPAILSRLGVNKGVGDPQSVQLIQQDESLIGHFEAPLRMHSRDLTPLQVTGSDLVPGLTLRDSAERTLVPVAIAPWGGFALSPYLFQESAAARRWVIDPFAFVTRALRLVDMPTLDATTENGRRIATVHLDGDGFASRAEVPGTPYSGEVVLKDFIQAHDYLTSVSVIEGEIGAKGMYPYLTKTLEPIARRIFADPKVEPATHTFSHPFFWEPEKARLRDGFNPEYGMNMAIPNYPVMDMNREIVGSRDYINTHLLPPGKEVKLIFWSGEALPSPDAIGIAYAAGMANVNGAETYITRANPSLTGLNPLLRPTRGGLQIYAPVINENLYTNLWNGPFYGFERVVDTFEITDAPRRLRGINLYYHFYSGTKQASLRAMADIYTYMDRQQPISLWMGDYLRRVRGLYEGGLAKRLDGKWQLRSLQGMRTVRLPPEMGWPDMLASSAVAGVRDLPQGRYVHLASDNAVLALQPGRDSAPSLEQANIPLTQWHYRSEREIELSFAGKFDLRFSVRYAGSCELNVGQQRIKGIRRGALVEFAVNRHEVSNAILSCR